MCEAKGMKWNRSTHETKDKENDYDKEKAEEEKKLSFLI